MLLVEWKELLSKKPRELIFTGENGFSAIRDGDKLDEKLFDFGFLNHLELTKMPIGCLPPKLGHLTNLTNLIICNNQLAALPAEIRYLRKLKFLDVSYNQLESLPDEIGLLACLQSLICSVNKLSTFPDSLSKLTELHVVKFDQNEFTSFPVSLCSENMKSHLADVCAQKNQIEYIPGDIRRLAALKILDLSDNKLKIIPKELGDCSKLKEINLKGNQLSDRKLLKMVEQNKQKMIFDYIKAHCPKAVVKATPGTETTTETATSDNEENSESVANGAAVVSGKKNQKKPNSNSTSSQDAPATGDTIKILSFKPEKQVLVTATPAILEERKIVCCVVRNVDLSQNGILKKFLAAQTSLHEGLLCGKRTRATIATHDLALIEGNPTFDLKPPTRIKLVPLGRSEMTAGELYKLLNAEADAYRKEKKRATYSGIHKYLFLLKGKCRYPVMSDAAGKVISFPPLTNAECTKISEQTKDLFLEVTGESTPTCKKVMEALLHDMLKMGLGASEPLPEGATGEPDERPKLLEVEPVKVINPEGKLYVSYPSRIDLYFEDVAVIRSADVQAAE